MHICTVQRFDLNFRSMRYVKSTYYYYYITQERKKKRRGERKAKRKMYGAGKEGRRRGGKVDKDCDQVNMKCFVHDNDHWKIPPLWKCEFIYLLIY